MSSMRNAVSRRSHRERAQPLERRRLGLLEKHKDYSLRAKDFKKKKAQLKSLREKAADRNEDEFYFGMMSRKGAGSRIKDGRTWTGTLEGDRGNKAMDVDTVRLLKTQDLGYVRTMRQVALKELKRLEQQLILTRGVGADDEDEDDHDDDDDDDDELNGRLGMSAKPKAARKIVFLEDEEERETVIQDQLDEEDDDDDKDDQSDKKSGKEGDDADQAKALRNLKRELEHARKKVKTLSHVETQLEVQRAKMAKTATSGGMTRRGKKIMVRTRKR